MRNVPVLDTKRIRRIKGSFGFVPHRFLNDGFFTSLNRDELALYFFLVLASDRFGISWYGDKALCKRTGLKPGALDEIRRSLASKELISFSPPFVQVLELPEQPVPEAAGNSENPASRILKSLEGGSK
ncbi:MAG: hypothetical protein GY866_35020 [Proteobacteria bacterium]|nr:hypothetical protein [Pseudomonadota bacterium]